MGDGTPARSVPDLDGPLVASAPRDFAAQIERRRRFLEQQLSDDRDALAAVIEETSPTSDAAMVVRLSIKQFETELAWLDEVKSRHRPG